jgi:hypothetical protein
MYLYISYTTTPGDLHIRKGVKCKNHGRTASIHKVYVLKGMLKVSCLYQYSCYVFPNAMYISLSYSPTSTNPNISLSHVPHNSYPEPLIISCLLHSIFRPNLDKEPDYPWVWNLDPMIPAQSSGLVGGSAQCSIYHLGHLRRFVSSTFAGLARSLHRSCINCLLVRLGTLIYKIFGFSCSIEGSYVGFSSGITRERTRSSTFRRQKSEVE